MPDLRQCCDLSQAGDLYNILLRRIFMQIILIDMVCITNIPQFTGEFQNSYKQCSEYLRNAYINN